jgi:hypothetical protein
MLYYIWVYCFFHLNLKIKLTMDINYSFWKNINKFNEKKWPGHLESHAIFFKKKKNKANILFWRQLVSVPCAMRQTQGCQFYFCWCFFLIRMIHFGFESFWYVVLGLYYEQYKLKMTRWNALKPKCIFLIKKIERQSNYIYV